jgi:hypothetical protein
MESELALVKYFIQQGDPLTLISQTNWETPFESGHWTDNIKKEYPDSKIPHVREFTNSKGKFFVINDSFYSEINQFMNPIQITKTYESIALLHQLITIALGKQKPTKVIYQDYTGNDTTLCYTNFFDGLNREELINNVCFDVTQQDGGCYIELRPDMVQLDESGNFIQEKYDLLTKHKNSPYYLKILRARIDMIAYPTVWNYVKLKESADFTQLSVNKVEILASSYSVEFNSKNEYNELLEQYFNLIQIVIRDIVRSRDIDDSLADYLLENLENRTNFINSLCLLKFE